jgi:hypothetical protein
MEFRVPYTLAMREQAPKKPLQIGGTERVRENEGAGSQPNVPGVTDNQLILLR